MASETIIKSDLIITAPSEAAVVVRPIYGDIMKHKDSGSKLYWVWHSMKNRCNNSKVPCFRYYGGKGVSVCPSWREYAPFKEWANSHGYKEGLSIDRVDSNLGYTPENCRWISFSENRKRAAVKHGSSGKENDKTLTIRLPGGDIIKTSNRAKKERITFSEAVRRAIRAWLGL